MFFAFITFKEAVEEFFFTQYNSQMKKSTNKYNYCKLHFVLK